MADYDNTNRGVLFFEEDPETERHPNYNGNINVEGQDYWLSAWDKVSKSGKNFISLSIKKKEPKQDDLWPAKTGKESDSWQQAREKFKKDDVTDTQEVSLDDIPF